MAVTETISEATVRISGAISCTNMWRLAKLQQPVQRFLLLELPVVASLLVLQIVLVSHDASLQRVASWGLLVNLFTLFGDRRSNLGFLGQLIFIFNMCGYITTSRPDKRLTGLV
jgi:hypothetical protein